MGENKAKLEVRNGMSLRDNVLFLPIGYVCWPNDDLLTELVDIECNAVHCKI